MPAECSESIWNLPYRIAIHQRLGRAEPPLRVIILCFEMAKTVRENKMTEECRCKPVAKASRFGLVFLLCGTFLKANPRKTV